MIYDGNAAVLARPCPFPAAAALKAKAITERGSYTVWRPAGAGGELEPVMVGNNQPL